MPGEVYFYICGVLVNAAFVFWLVFGIVATVRNYMVEKRLAKRYATKNLDREKCEKV